MNSKIKVRFAPSPTGQVHIGNIRTAIFNYLFARNAGGRFLLRVEDTDIERSTQEAIDRLLESMEWLGLDYDGEIFYQSRHCAEHIEAAEKLLKNGYAYKPAPKTSGESLPILFRIPWDTDDNPAVRSAGDVEIDVHRDEKVEISSAGITYAQVSRKGKPIPVSASLAGYHGLRILDTENTLLFELDENIDAIFSDNESFSIEGAAKFIFERREVFFNDIIKGVLAKPLDTMKDFVILRSNGTPVFHLANVLDDISQGITHIIRGDDHVENTYRHIFLFQHFNHQVPVYGHMPMIVNDTGKPLSKRDGDAFVGDFRRNGVLAPALFNYLAFLGWSPGDEREKMSKEELTEAFSIERVISSPARFDSAKLANINGRYIAVLDTENFRALLAEFAENTGRNEILSWIRDPDGNFAEVAELMQSRTKLLSDIDNWSYFYADEIEYNTKDLKKSVKPELYPVLQKLAGSVTESADFAEDDIERLLRSAEADAGLSEGKLNRPFRVAITGRGSGADLIKTALLIGKENIVKRVGKLLKSKG